MKDIIELLEEKTSENGSFTLQYNVHKQTYDTDPKEIAKDYFGSTPDKEDLEEFLKLDFNKPIYFLWWYPLTPVGFVILFANSKEDLIKQIEEYNEN